MARPGTRTASDSPPAAVQRQSKNSELYRPLQRISHSLPRGQEEASSRSTDPRVQCGIIQNYLLPRNLSKNSAPRTATVSASGAEIEDERNENADVSPDEVLRTFNCEFPVEANLKLMTQLLDMFHAAKISGHVVEVGPNELCTKWKSSGTSLKSSAKCVRSWTAAMRCLVRFLSCSALARVWTTNKSKASVKSKKHKC